MATSVTPPPFGAAASPSRPRGRVTALRLIGAGVVLALLTAGAGTLVAQFFQQRRTETTTVRAAVARLVVRNGVGDVRIRAATDGAPVEVTRSMRWSFRRPEVTVLPADGALTVTGECVRLFWMGGFCSTDLEVVVPPRTALDLDTGAGDIRASGMSGPVVAEARTGDLVVTASGASTVNAHTGVGQVTVTGGAPDAQLRARTGTGDVTFRLEAAPSKVSAETGTGDVTISVPPGDSYQVDTDAGTGDVQVRIPQDPAAQRHIIARSGTGDITVRAS